ncbi:MAG: hypothetical protein K8R99_12265 [Actinomycetia bacterium]|nr:hypothetical protein [Actinomycetes bacterium]
MAGLKSLSIRAWINRAVSARVDAQMEWRMSGIEESLATLQRLTTEMSTVVASRLTALETAALADRKATGADS